MLENRKQAGIRLAQKLKEKMCHLDNTVIIALPRGGVPVAYEVAQALGLPLEIFTVKKIGSPNDPEVAMGAVSEEGDVFFNEHIINILNLDQYELNHLKIEALSKAKIQGQYLRGNKKIINLKNKNIILVDDGIATGATVKVAIKLLRQNRVKQIVLAVPVCSEQSWSELNKMVEEFYVLEIPEFFNSVGTHYIEFPQVSNADVVFSLKRAELLDSENKRRINNDMDQL